MSHATVDIRDEADRLCSVIENRSDGLAEARLGRRFRLDRFTFRLHRHDRNTLYRVFGAFDWFLKLPDVRNERAIARERLGATTIGETVAAMPEYGGASVIRTSLNPAYVLAATINGQPMDRVLVVGSLLPLPGVRARLEASFATLGLLLATLHATARLPQGAPEGEKREFAFLEKGLRRVKSPDALSRAIEAWYETHALPDQGNTFVHGNMRLDNVFRFGNRIGFLDFEHCGSGSFYQDLARPIVHLLQVGALSTFTHRRITACLDAYLGAYRRAHTYETVRLDAFVGARLSRNYLDIHRKGLHSARIAGLPVPRSALAQLTMAVLSGGIEEVVPRLSQ